MATAIERDHAIELATGARRQKREAARARRRAKAALEELRAFCRRVGLQVEDIRTEADGHGPGEQTHATDATEG